MPGIWVNQQADNSLWSKKAVEQKPKDQWITVLYSSLSTKSICFTYNMYQGIYCREIDLRMLRKDTKTRANNRLTDVTGRYQNLAREE